MQHTSCKYVSYFKEIFQNIPGDQKETVFKSHKHYFVEHTIFLVVCTASREVEFL